VGWTTRGAIPSTARDFLSFILSRLVLGPTQPPTQWTLAALSPEVKVAEALPSSVEVKISGATPLLLLYVYLYGKACITLNFPSF
jgi:hypothetical protein